MEKVRWQKILAVGLLTAVVEKWLLMSWFRWPDFVTDFGRELYIPWRIVSGDPLYHDASYLFGPLSYYFNALIFYLFGPSLTAIVSVNLFLIVVLSFLLFNLFRFLGGFWLGYTGLLVFLGIFAFGHYTIWGNYNFVCPYAHQLIHGLVLSFVAFALLKRWLLKPSWALVCGIVCVWGLVFFTKFEIFLALSIALLSAVAIDLFVVKRASQFSFKWTLPFVVVIMAGVVFVFSFPTFEKVLEPIFLRYWKIGISSLSKGFYGNLSGFDKPAANAWLILKSSGIYGVVFLFLAFAAASISRLKRESLRYFSLGVLSVTLVMIAVLLKANVWWLGVRVLPVALIITIIIFVRRLFSQRLNRKNEARVILLVVLSIFSLTLLIKIFLNVHVYHYGFALAMPGTVLMAGLAVRYLPAMGRGRGARPWVFRFLIIALLLAVVIGHIKWGRVYYSHKDAMIGQGQDAFYSWDVHAFSTPTFFNIALQWLDKDAGPGDTLAVLPEGVMMNYLLRMRNPTGYIVLMPGDDQDKAISAFIKGEPSYIVFVYRNMSEYNAGFFGQDYGQKLYQWVLSNYTKVFHIEAPTQEGLEFVSIFKKGKFPVEKPLQMDLIF